MKRSLLTACAALALFGVCHAAETEWKHEKAPSINGVAIGSALKEVESKLGKPPKKMDFVSEIMGPYQELLYPGLKIGVYKSNEQAGESVWEIEVSSGSWSIYPGVKIGMTREAVIDVLGPPSSEESEGGRLRIWWPHPLKEVGFRIDFINGNAIRLWMGEDWS